MNQQIDELIDRYRAGTLTPDELGCLIVLADGMPDDELASHLWPDPDIFRPDDNKTVAADDPIFYRIKAGIDERIGDVSANKADFDRQHIRHFLPGYRTLAVAASVMLVLLAAAGYIIAGQYSSARHDALLYTTVVTHNNDKSTVTLPDGSTVTLRGESSLTYPSIFDNNERRITFRGLGYFAIAPDHDKPLSVETPGMTVTVHGTEFSILSRSNGDFSEVSLDKGSVSVSSPLSDSTLSLKPGQTATVDRQNGAITVASASASSMADWNADELVFRNTPPDSLIRAVENAYNIRLTPQITDNITDSFYGTLPWNDLATALRILGGVYDIRMPYTYCDDQLP